MSQFAAILQAKRRIAGHQIASIRSESLLKVSVVGSAAVLLWYGVLRGFGEGFYWLQERAFENPAEERRQDRVSGQQHAEAKNIPETE